MPPTGTTAADSELVERAQTGDRAAFAELLRRHDDRLRGLAFRLLADRGAMDDALQEAYLKAYGSLGRFRPGRDWGAWIYRIAYNACIDEIRKRKQELAAQEPAEAGEPAEAEELAEPAEADEPAEAEEPGPPDRGSAVSASETVRSALADLPVDQRVTLVLVDGEGLDHREVATILGVAPSTVASRLQRARLALRRVLGEEVL